MIFPVAALSRIAKRPMIATAITAICAALLTNASAADVIELKTGQKLEGDVLKETGGEIVVDLGVDIVRIPVTQIKSRHAREDAVKDDTEGKSEKAEGRIRSGVGKAMDAVRDVVNNEK